MTNFIKKITSGGKNSCCEVEIKEIPTQGKAATSCCSTDINQDSDSLCCSTDHNQTNPVCC